MINLSIVIPCFNESESLQALVKKFSKNVKSKNNLNNNVIEGEFEDKED